MSARTSRNYFTVVDENTPASRIELFTPSKLAGGTIFQFRMVAVNLDTDYNLDVGFSQGAGDIILGQAGFTGDSEQFRSFTLMQYISNLRSMTVEQNTALVVVPLRVLTATERCVFQLVVEEPGEA